jgi:Phage integrase family
VPSVSPNRLTPSSAGSRAGGCRTILADIIRRAAKRAGIEKHVTAHTLRHTAATWLRQELGDTRLVAEYLGHADFATVARYAHVDRHELFVAASRLEELAVPRNGSAKSRDVEPAGDTTPDRSSVSGHRADDPPLESVRPRQRRRRRRRGRRR